MITYPQLWAASPRRWRAAAAAWRELAALTQRRAAEFPEIAGELAAAWSGGAARAAVDRLGVLGGRLTLARLGWWEADQALTGYAAELARAKAMLAAAVATADASGVTVDADGRVAAVPYPAPSPLAAVPYPGSSPRSGAVFPDPAGAVRRTVTAIEAALDAAARADVAVARRLGDLAAAAAAGWPVSRPRAVPAVGTEPAAVRRWWAALTEAERRWLVLHRPDRTGRLDGLPAEVRDRANRLLLAQQRQQLAAARATATDPAQVRRLDRLLHGIDGVAARLAAPDGARAYLLALDPAGEGRAVVALGDPDRADNILTYVPGMTAELADLDGELNRARQVADRAGRLDGSQRTAAVLWLDYDAPDGLAEAANADRAQAAGPALHRFQEGLRTSHDGPPAHQVVLGHSYGSLVVGETAARFGLAADSVVFAGSPGVGVDSARELGLPAGRVWSTTSATDVIQYAAVSPGGLVGDLAVAAALPGVGPALAFGRPEDELWFGRNPSDPSFGARVFGSQVGAGHVGYWAPDGVALDNLARITLGGTKIDGIYR